MLPYSNRVVEFPRRYQLVKVPGTSDVYDLVPVPGTITNPGRAMNEEFFDSISTDIGNKLSTSNKATQSEAENGSNNTKYMTPLRVFQQINAKALPSKQMSIKTGTITNNGTIPQTEGYSNYIYLVAPNNPTNNYSSSSLHPDKFAGFRMYCSVDQETRKVTAYTQAYYYTNGSSQGWDNPTNFTVDYYEIAYN